MLVGDNPGRPRVPGEEHMTMLDNGGAAAAAAAARRPHQGDHHPGLHEGRDRGVKRQPVLVDFWAPWCGPCKQLTPVLEKVVKAAKGKVKLVKMNIDEHPAIPGQMGIQSIPAVIAFVNGQPADGFMGALPESQVTAFIERLTKDAVGGEEKDLLKEADAALAEGDARRRGRALCPSCWRRTQPTSQRSPGSPAPMSRPARSSRPSRSLALVPEAKRNDAAVAAARAALELAEQATRSARSASLSRRSRPIRSTIRRASISRSRSTPRASATRRVDHLMEIVKRDRKWNDDGARKQLVQFFEAWGPTDEATIAGRSACRRFCLRRCLISSGGHAQDGERSMPMNVIYRGSADLPEIIPVFPSGGRAAVAARPDAAQHFRAALSRDGRRFVARRPSADRHDPARPSRPIRGPTRGQAHSVQGRLRRPHHPDRRDRRRPLPDPAHRRRALPHRGRAQGRDRLSAVPRHLSCRSPTISSRARARTRSTARRCLKHCTAFLKANNLKTDWEGIENAPNEALVNALAMMSPYGAAEKQALLEAPDLKIARRDPGRGHRDGAREKTAGGGETPLQ